MESHGKLVASWRGWGVGSWLWFVRAVGRGGFGVVGGCSGLGVVVWWPCVVADGLVKFQVVVGRVVV